MRLHAAVNQYITYRQSLGERFRTDGFILNAFACTMGKKIALTDVKSESVRKYLAGTAPAITANWHRRYYALHGFYKYALARDYVSTSPLPAVTPKLPRRFVPYIYNVKELRALFKACFNYQRFNVILEPYMVRVLLLLLYGAGLRIREAISLTMADVDLNQALIMIRETKFRKTRLVPLGKQLTHILLRYAARRRREKYSLNLEAPFFVGRNGKAVNQNTIECAFKRIRKEAGIQRSDGGRFQPRLHDLRHTFAVHRLTTWYKEGADVQRLLPVLYVDLGHACLSSTSTYLTMTPELLEEAGRRFEQYAFMEASHD